MIVNMCLTIYVPWHSLSSNRREEDSLSTLSFENKKASRCMLDL